MNNFRLFILLLLALAVEAKEDERAKTTTLESTRPPQTIPANLIDRFPELTTLNRKTTAHGYVPAQTVLEYKPIVSSYHPHPVTLAQIIPPGTPWPVSATETTLSPNLVDRFPELSSTKTTTRPSTHQVLTYKPTRPSFLPQPGWTIVQLIPSGEPLPAGPVESTIKPPNLADRLPELSSTTTKPSTHLILTYKPSRPPHLPQPVTIGQIVPPGEPLPAGPQTTTENYVTVPPEVTTKNPNLDMRLPELTTKLSTNLVLTYKPTKPSFLPQPAVTVNQIVPSGDPLLAGPETTTTAPPNLADRLPETVTASQTTSPTSTRIILTYKPQRPWYHPRPGNTLGQIVPPGKPWPASPEGYSSFSVTTHPPWLKDSDSLPHLKSEELQSLKEEDVLPEPNALQYYGPRITAPHRYTTPVNPYTSGTQKTTLSDIVDILKEVHNITIVSNKPPPTPSHLLPYDADRRDGPFTGTSVRRPPPAKNYGEVIRPRQQFVAPAVVYDGTAAINNAGIGLIEERVFHNPKFVPT